MPVPLHEVIEAFANFIGDHKDECVAELRMENGKPLDLASSMREWSELLRESWNEQARVNLIRDLRRSCMKLSGSDIDKVAALAKLLASRSQGATAVAAPQAEKETHS